MVQQIVSNNDPMAMTTQERRRALKECLLSLHDNLEKLAGIVRAMVDAGEEITELSPKTVRLLLAVSRGRLQSRYFTHPLAQRLLCFESEEQERVFEDAPVRVISSDGSHLMVRPSAMTPEIIRQVFAKDHIRDDAEQRAYVETKRIYQKPGAQQGNEPSVKFNKRLGLVVSGSATISPEEILRYAAMLVGS